MKIVENSIDTILQHYDRPAHHSHKTTAAYGDENGYSFHAELSVTDKELGEAFFEYISHYYYYYYILLFL